MVWHLQVGSSYEGDVPLSAIINLEPDDIKRILKLSNCVKRNKVFCIQSWDYSPDWLASSNEEDREEFDGSIDSSRIVITDSDVYWKAGLKHADVEFSTGCIYLSELKEIQTVLKAPVEGLVKLMGGLEYENSKKALAERLKQ